MVTMALLEITPLMPMVFRTTLVLAPMIPIPTLDSTIANGHRGSCLFRCHLHTTFCVLYTFVVIISPSLLLVPSWVFGCSVESQFPSPQRVYFPLHHIGDRSIARVSSLTQKHRWLGLQMLLVRGSKGPWWRDSICAWWRRLLPWMLSSWGRPTSETF